MKFTLFLCAQLVDYLYFFVIYLLPNIWFYYILWKLLCLLAMTMYLKKYKLYNKGTEEEIPLIKCTIVLKLGKDESPYTAFKVPW